MKNLNRFEKLTLGIFAAFQGGTFILILIPLFLDLMSRTTFAGGFSNSELAMVGLTGAIVFFTAVQVVLHRTHQKFEQKVHRANWDLALHSERVNIYSTMVRGLLLISVGKVCPKEEFVEMKSMLRQAEYHVPEAATLLMRKFYGTFSRYMGAQYRLGALDDIMNSAGMLSQEEYKVKDNLECTVVAFRRWVNDENVIEQVTDIFEERLKLPDEL